MDKRQRRLSVQRPETIKTFAAGIFFFSFKKQRMSIYLLSVLIHLRTQQGMYAHPSSIGSNKSRLAHEVSMQGGHLANPS